MSAKTLKRLERELDSFVEAFFNGTVTDAKRKRTDVALKALSTNAQRKGAKRKGRR